MVIDCLKISGAIAQLGERLNGIQEVSGSIPLSSTILTGQRPAKPFNEPAIRSGWRVFCCPPQAAAIRHRRWSRRGTGPELLSSLRATPRSGPPLSSQQLEPERGPEEGLGGCRCGRRRARHRGYHQCRRGPVAHRRWHRLPLLNRSPPTAGNIDGQGHHGPARFFFVHNPPPSGRSFRHPLPPAGCQILPAGAQLPPTRSPAAARSSAIS